MKKNAIRWLFIISLFIALSSGGISLLNISRFQEISGGITVLDMQFCYSPVRVSNLFENIGFNGRRFYVEFLLLDFIFIISMAISQSIIIFRLHNKIIVPVSWKKLIYLPYIRAVFDIGENLFLLILLFNFPPLLTGLAVMACIMTVLKWVLLVAVTAVIIISIIIPVKKYIILRRKNMIKQIKVIGIISSPRVNGSTATLVREALKAAEQEGARVTEIFLKKYRIEYCRGCLTCMQQGNCVITDDMFNLKQIVSQADGIILSSPNYANSHNAIMKNFLERLGLFEFLTSSLFGGKYVAGISTAGGGGAKRVAKGLTNLTRNGIFKRSYVSGVLGTGVHGRQVEEVPNALKQAYKLGKKVVLDIKKQKKYPLQNFWGRHFIDFFIKSSFKRYIKRDRQTATKAVFENLALRQLI